MVGYTQLAYGLDRGGIDERWLGSTSPAANENRTTPNAERRTPNAKRQRRKRRCPLMFTRMRGCGNGGKTREKS